MKKKYLIFTLVLLLLGVTVPSQAALHDRGGGLIYDDVLNITWLADANYAMTSGEDDDGLMNFFDAQDWVYNLEYAGEEDWWLPLVTTHCTGVDCGDSELGYMFYVNLGGKPGVPISASTDPDLALFDTSIQLGHYWTMTSFSPNQNYAYDFDFSAGKQGLSSKMEGEAYVWAVAEGDIAPPVVPEPISSILFVTGGMLLGVKRYFKRKKTDN